MTTRCMKARALTTYTRHDPQIRIPTVKFLPDVSAALVSAHASSPGRGDPDEPGAWQQGSPSPPQPDGRRTEDVLTMLASAETLSGATAWPTAGACSTSAGPSGSTPAPSPLSTPSPSPPCTNARHPAERSRDPHSQPPGGKRPAPTNSSPSGAAAPPDRCRHPGARRQHRSFSARDRWLHGRLRGRNDAGTVHPAGDRSGAPGRHTPRAAEQDDPESPADPARGLLT